MIIKRMFDYLFSIIGLIIISPLLVFVSLLIKIDSSGPVFFKQKRIGQNGDIFEIYKFRTMINNAENIGSGLKTSSNDPRITKIGKILRKTSIDEIPQLINIIKGQMSFIGPRPAPVVLLDRMNTCEKKRLNFKPGLTGWAQINGRTNLTWKEKFEFDIWYCENFSLLLDIKIFIKTIKYVLFSKNVYSDRFSEEVEELNKNI